MKIILFYFKTYQYDFMLNHPNVPSNFKQYYDKNMRDTVHYRKNIDTLEYQAAYPINGFWTVVISEPSEDYDKGLWLLKFTHECFHLFQNEMRKERIINPFTGEYKNYHEMNFPYDYKNDTLLAAMHLEAEVIFNAVKSDTVDKIIISNSKKLIRDAHLVLKNVIDNENKFKYKIWMEWNEGVARYTEREIAAIVKDLNESYLNDDFQNLFPGIDFKKVWEENYKKALNPIRFIGEGVRGRAMFYYSGMGKAYLLDKMNGDWKNKYFKENLDEIILSE